MYLTRRSVKVFNEPDAAIHKLRKKCYVRSTKASTFFAEFAVHFTPINLGAAIGKVKTSAQRQQEG